MHPHLFCGERGIRTPGTSQYNGFQDRRDRPLCHLSKTHYQEVLPSESGAKVRNLFEYANFFTFFNSKKKETQSLPFGEQSIKRPCLLL